MGSLTDQSVEVENLTNSEIWYPWYGFQVYGEKLKKNDMSHATFIPWTHPLDWAKHADTSRGYSYLQCPSL